MPPTAEARQWNDPLVNLSQNFRNFTDAIKSGGEKLFKSGVRAGEKVGAEVGRVSEIVGTETKNAFEFLFEQRIRLEFKYYTELTKLDAVIPGWAPFLPTLIDALQHHAEAAGFLWGYKPQTGERITDMATKERVIMFTFKHFRAYGCGLLAAFELASILLPPGEVVVIMEKMGFLAEEKAIAAFLEQLPKSVRLRANTIGNTIIRDAALATIKAYEKAMRFEIVKIAAAKAIAELTPVAAAQNATKKSTKKITLFSKFFGMRKNGTRTEQAQAAA